VLAFAGFHGISAWVSWAIRRERDTGRIGWLVSMSAASVDPAGYLFLVVLATGVLAGFMGGHWGKGWIWASIALFIALGAAMAFLALDFRKIREAAGLPFRNLKAGSPAPADVIIAAAAATRFTLMAGLGFGGLLILLWLMMFKPF
jgi:hypothetical protein